LDIAAAITDEVCDRGIPDVIADVKYGTGRQPISAAEPSWRMRMPLPALPPLVMIRQTGSTNPTVRHPPLRTNL
jgi:hypothetical protein